MSDKYFTYSENITTTPDQLFEQTTVSPHVNQFMVDYLFTHDKLLASNVNPQIDTGMGEADLALSIVNDAYEHERRTKAQQVEQPVESVPIDNS